MIKNKLKSLNEIWQQVPPDYYHHGVARNPFQWLWHTSKVRTFKQLTTQKHFTKILDIGCAGGFMTNKIAQMFPDSKIYGIDAYRKAIKYAKNQFPHIYFKVADAHKLPFADETFDLVICYETIEHVLDPKKILLEMRRIISKEGIVIIAMDSGNLMFQIIWILWEKTFGRAWQGAHLHPFHHNELEKIIIASGFKIIKKHFSHFGMEVSFVLKK